MEGIPRRDISAHSVQRNAEPSLRRGGSSPIPRCILTRSTVCFTWGENTRVTNTTRGAHTQTHALSLSVSLRIFFPSSVLLFFFPESLEPLSTSSWRQHVLEFRGGRNQSHQPLVGIGPACAFALCVPALRSSLAVLRPPVRHPLSQGCRAGRNIFGARPPLLARRRRLQPARREIVAGRHCRDVTITGPSFVARASLWGSAQLGDWTCFVLFALR